VKKIFILNYKLDQFVYNNDQLHLNLSNVCAFYGQYESTHSGNVSILLCGFMLTFLIGRKLIAQLKKEADYRYKLVNIRDNAE
jgi:ABC-type uncharacterized transport system fused permease/ATPase subunit